MDRCKADVPDLYTVGSAQARCLLHEPAPVSVEVES